MSKRVAKITAAVFGFFLVWAWFSKPAPLDREFYKRGLHAIYIQTIRDGDIDKYQYELPYIDKAELTNLLDRSGFRNDPSIPNLNDGLIRYSRPDPVFFWRPQLVVEVTPSNPNVIRTNFKLK